MARFRVIGQTVDHADPTCRYRSMLTHCRTTIVKGRVQSVFGPGMAVAHRGAAILLRAHMRNAKAAGWLSPEQAQRQTDAALKATLRGIGDSAHRAAEEIP